MAHLALDLGLSLGWAIYHDDGSIESGMRDLARAGATDGARFHALRVFLIDTRTKLRLEGEQLEGVIYERVDFLVKKNGVNAAHLYGAIWGSVVGWCHGNGIPCQGIPVPTIKAHICRPAFKTAAKPLVTKRIKELFPHVRDHNEADAVAIVLTAQKKFPKEAT
jgi:hypothetical protein